MKINLNQKYKINDKNLINGFYILTGKELNKIIEKAYKEVIQKNAD